MTPLTKRNAARRRPSRLPARRAIEIHPAAILPKPDWIRVRLVRQPSVSRDEAGPARAAAAHGVRRSLVPQHRRVLRQRHGDLHDPRRSVHASLSVLRCRARAARAARCRRAARISRITVAALRLAACRHHQRRSRRPARWRRRAFPACIRACARARRTHASKCWCPTFAAVST